MQEFINQTPKLKAQQDLLIFHPGIAELTAAKLLAEIGDISVFENAPQLAAYAGLNPRGFRSGPLCIKNRSSQNREANLSGKSSTCQLCLLNAITRSFVLFVLV